MSRILATAFLLAAILPAAADPLLTVIGRGSVISTDNEARLSVTADARGATTAEAIAAQRTAAANIAKALAKAGVAQKDFAVTNLNFNTQYGNPILPGQPRIVREYNCTTTVTVVVEQPDRLADVLQALADAGVSQQARVNFVAKSTEAQQVEARAAAVKDAFARGQLLAKQAGVTLGRVVAVSDGVPGGNFNYADVLQAIGGTGGASHTVNATVTVSWEIK